MDSSSNTEAAAAAERKRQRLEAWRRKQEQPTPLPKISLSFRTATTAAPVKTKGSKKAKAFDASSDEEDEQHDSVARKKRGLDLFDLGESELEEPPEKRLKMSASRWGATILQSPSANVSSNDTTSLSVEPPTKDNSSAVSSNAAATADFRDALDSFMDQLQSGDSLAKITVASLDVDMGGSMMRPKKKRPTIVSGSVITPQDLARLHHPTPSLRINAPEPEGDGTSAPLYSPKDWLSDASDAESEVDEEQEEQERRMLIDALKAAPASSQERDEETFRPAQLAVEVRNEKTRREERLRELEVEAKQARKQNSATAVVGRIFNEGEGSVMEEAERTLEAAKAAPDALTVLAELNKKKELKAVDHSKVDYEPFIKNLYRVPRSLADLKHDEVVDRRARLKVRVRGPGAPAPVSTWAECGLPEKLIDALERQEILAPYAVQAQCIPCIMAGRDVIGIAKTGK
jgi:hypothetical protein